MHRSATVLGVFCLIGCLAAPAWTADCNQPGSLLTNCDFNTDLSGWSLQIGLSSSHIPGDGGTAPGSAEVVSENWGDMELTVMAYDLCVPFSGAATFDAGFSAKVMSSTDTVECTFTGSYYSDGACTTRITGFDSGNSLVDGSWTEAFTPDVVPDPSTQSLRAYVFCESALPFTVRYDDVLFGQDLVPVELMSFSIE